MSIGKEEKTCGEKMVDVTYNPSLLGHVYCHHHSDSTKSPCLGRSALVCSSFSELRLHTEVPGLIALQIDESLLTPLGAQVSGHAIIYKLPDGRLLKRSNANEIEAYQKLQLHESLLPYIPTFYGYCDLDLQLETTTRVTEVPSEHPQRRHTLYVVLENLTSGFLQPSIMDVKLGKQTYEQSASLEKILKQETRAKQTTTFRHGARVDGLSVFQPATQTYYKLKHECWHKSLKESILLYLSTGERGQYRFDSIRSFLEQLQGLHDALNHHQLSMNFLQSSLLFIYEGDTSLPPKTRIALIDFDHAHFFNFEDPSIEPSDLHKDCGCSFGVANLTLTFTTILESLSSHQKKI